MHRIDGHNGRDETTEIIIARPNTRPPAKGNYVSKPRSEVTVKFSHYCERRHGVVCCGQTRFHFPHLGRGIMRNFDCVSSLTSSSPLSFVSRVPNSASMNFITLALKVFLLSVSMRSNNCLTSNPPSGVAELPSAAFELLCFCAKAVPDVAPLDNNAATNKKASAVFLFPRQV
jgi:hypothetical protein